METVASFAVDPRHMRAFKAIAKRQGQSVSALVRRAMFEFLNRERRRRLADRALLASVTGPTSPARRAAVADEAE